MVSIKFAFLTALFSYIIKQLTTDDAKPLLGKYMVPGRWYALKYFLLFIPLKIYQWYKKNTAKCYPPTLFPFKEEYRLDDLHLTPFEKDGDSIYFNGFDSTGNGLVCRLIRRNNRKAEVWLTLVSAEHGVYSCVSHPDAMVYNSNGKEFRAGGLCMRMKEPLRLWRIHFSGTLRKGLPTEWSVNDVQTDDYETKYVTFAFQWRAMSEPFHFQSKGYIHPAAFAKSFATEKWNKEFLSRMSSESTYSHLHQWGQLLGELTFEGETTKQLRLRGLRDRSFGELDWGDRERNVKLAGLTEDGFMFYINVSSFVNGPSHMLDGCAMYHNCNIRAVSDSDLYLYVFGEDERINEQFTIHFTADNKLHTVQGSVLHTMRVYGGERWESKVYHQIVALAVDGARANGIIEYTYKNSERCTIQRPPVIPILKEIDPPVSSSQYSDQQQQPHYVLPFSHPACTLSRLTGGKGMQLALLSTVQEELHFTVPDGFCLTTTAFKQQLKFSDHLRDMLDTLHRVAIKNDRNEYEDMCNKTVEAFLREPICDQVRQAVEQQLESQFTGRLDGVAFAVRSSAVGEDSEDISAAGQMETLLGMRGKDQILHGISKCWASHFTYTAVEYRRMHGVEIVGEMCVCIQEMVPSETSGVLFTVDPVTGNSSVMSINANYGLGESVVSGICEPDTVIIHRDHENTLKVHSKSIGSKKVKIVSDDSGGTLTLDAELQQFGDESCCIPDSLALRLAHIAVQLEARFTSARDIEWAAVGERVYLLQARPVTTVEMESEFELSHEFDTALLTDYEILTRENVGEVLPGALTPITIDHVTNVMDMAIQTMYATNENTVYGMKRQNAELALFGHTLDNDRVEDLILRRYGKLPLWKRIWRRIRITSFFFLAARDIRRQIANSLKKFDNLDLTNKSIREVYDLIDKHSFEGGESFRCHILCSMFCNLWNAIIVNIITKGSDVWTSEHLSDVALLYSDCDNMISADVPRALKMLASEVAKVCEPQTFCEMEKMKALEWIRSNDSLDSQFASFLKAHGHRCVKEMEIRTVSWSSEPVTLVEVLQSMLKHEGSYTVNPKKVVSIEDTINMVKTPLTNTTKKILKLLLPKARKAVAGREESKSMAVKFIDISRQHYRVIGKMMVEEGLLPDEDLIYFLTHRELGKVIEQRSPKLIAKAMRRLKLYPKLNELKFEEPIIIGPPVPINDQPLDLGALRGTMTLKGMPVCNGDIKGVARVITSLENAHEIQYGDILIVQYTDVGWSPYFPLVSGVVTELGGLLSHGAVIAREYGIPALVSVKNATKVFKSGDQVLLSGTKGMIMKIKEEEVEKGEEGGVGEEGEQF